MARESERGRERNKNFCCYLALVISSLVVVIRGECLNSCRRVESSRSTTISFVSLPKAGCGLLFLEEMLSHKLQKFVWPTACNSLTDPIGLDSTRLAKNENNFLIRFVAQITHLSICLCWAELSSAELFRKSKSSAIESIGNETRDWWTMMKMFYQIERLFSFWQSSWNLLLDLLWEKAITTPLKSARPSHLALFDSKSWWENSFGFFFFSVISHGSLSWLALFFFFFFSEGPLLYFCQNSCLGLRGPAEIFVDSCLLLQYLATVFTLALISFLLFFFVVQMLWLIICYLSFIRSFFRPSARPSCWPTDRPTDRPAEHPSVRPPVHSSQ